MIKLDGREVRVGDRLWSFICGWMRVSQIIPQHDYPIIGEYEVDSSGDDSFTAEGQYWKGENSPRCLFWEKPEFEIPKPKVLVKKSKWVYTSKDGGYDYEHVSSHLSEDQVYKLSQKLGITIIGKIENTEIEVEE